jgi:hypothetical protein
VSDLSNLQIGDIRRGHCRWSSGIRLRALVSDIIRSSIICSLEIHLAIDLSLRACGELQCGNQHASKATQTTSCLPVWRAGHLTVSAPCISCHWILAGARRSGPGTRVPSDKGPVASLRQQPAPAQVRRSSTFCGWSRGRRVIHTCAAQAPQMLQRVYACTEVSCTSTSCGMCRSLGAC